MSYFENNNGLVIKGWTTDTYTSGWKFELKIYDGNYIDTKFAKVEISGGGLKMLQSNGYIFIQAPKNNKMFHRTFQQDDLTLAFTYGESNKAQLKKCNNTFFKAFVLNFIIKLWLEHSHFISSTKIQINPSQTLIDLTQISKEILSKSCLSVLMAKCRSKLPYSQRLT